MSERFDFDKANALYMGVFEAANILDVRNGQMEKRFGDLGDYFKDAGYDEYAVDMTAANEAIAKVISQMRAVGISIARYAEQLRGVQ